MRRTLLPGLAPVGRSHHDASLVDGEIAVAEIETGGTCKAANLDLVSIPGHKRYRRDPRVGGHRGRYLGADGQAENIVIEQFDFYRACGIVGKPLDGIGAADGPGFTSVWRYNGKRRHIERRHCQEHHQQGKNKLFHFDYFLQR